MKSKISKFLSFIPIILKKPSLINLVLNSDIVAEQNFKKKYPNISPLPQISIDQLNENPANTIETFILEGGSLITDLQLLSSLAQREDVNSYFEIGTWRGESVFNVSKHIDDCTTINLSKEEINELGYHPQYGEQHGILSKKNHKILHLQGNTKHYDFAKLNRKFDLIFIDGDHSYEMVVNDTKKVFKHLVHNKSIVVWHDYAYSPQSIRHEVYQAILDGTDRELHSFLYHPKNTMCAIYFPEKLSSTKFIEMEFPSHIFDITINKKDF